MDFISNNSDDLKNFFMKLSKDITLKIDRLYKFQIKKKFNWAYIVEKIYTNL